MHPADHPLVKFKVPRSSRCGRGLGGHPFGLGGHGLMRLFHGLHRGGRWGHGGRWLARGSSGEGVKEVQQALKVPVDGFFGPQTEQAVKDFQTAQGMQADGIVGPQTRAKLFPDEKKECAGRSWGGRWLVRGAHGDSVKELQQALKIPVDGFFGQQTEQAVKDFQTAQGLPVDGVFGPRTRAKLFPEAHKAAEAAKEDSPKPAEPTKEETKELPQPAEKKEAAPKEQPWLRVGASGEGVKEVQRALGIHADGIFGRLTDRAVREFQFTHDLPVDGAVGPRTWAKLAEAKPPSQSETKPASHDAAMQALIGMGFSNVEMNTQLLSKYNGDVEQVVAVIVGGSQ